MELHTLMHKYIYTCVFIYRSSSIFLNVLNNSLRLSDVQNFHAQTISLQNNFPSFAQEK